MNRLAEIGETFLASDTLPIGAGHFSAIGDKPRAVLFHDRSELIAHTNSLAPCALRGQTQCLLDFGRKIEPLEHVGGVDVVLTGLVNDTDEIVGFGVCIVDDCVELHDFERSLETNVAYTDGILG